jgi:hypothetical protein
MNLAGGLAASGGIAVLSGLSRASTDDSLMDGSLNAVVLLNVQFREGVVIERGSLLDISEGRRIDNISIYQKMWLNLEIIHKRNYEAIAR